MKGVGSVNVNFTQSGSGLLFKSVGRNVSTVEGNSSQTIRMGGVGGRGVMGEGDVEFFWRSVGVVNGTVRRDEGRMLGLRLGDFFLYLGGFSMELLSPFNCKTISKRHHRH